MSKKWVMKTDITQEEWLEGRFKYVGASETAAVLGLDVHRTPFEFWAYKTKKIPRPDMDKGGRGRTKFGLAAENLIADLISEKFGLTIRKDNKIRIHERLDYWRANLDRVAIRHSSGPGVIELKTTSKESLKTWNPYIAEPNPIFMHHWTQVQAQMAISGFTWGALGVLPADSYQGFGDVELIEIERDDDFIEGAEREIKRFWEEHIIKDVAPEATTIKDFKVIHYKGGPPPIDVDENFVKALLKKVDMGESIAALKADLEKLEFQIKMAMGDSDTALFNGVEVATFKNNNEKYVDPEEVKKRFVELYGLCLEFNQTRLKEEDESVFNQLAIDQPGPRVLRPKKKNLSEVKWA